MKKPQKYKFYVTDLRYFLYLGFAFLFLIFVGIPAINEEIDLEFYADSDTYLEIAESDLRMEEILILGTNLVFPVSFLRAVNFSHFVIFFFQLFIAWFFYKTVVNYFNINRKTFLFYLLISPMFFSSIILINKEIFSILVVSLILRYIKTKKIQYVFFALICSMMVRWQMALFTLIVIGFILYKPAIRYPYFYLIILLILISITYYVKIDEFEFVTKVLDNAKEAKSNDGGGSFFIIMDIQNSNPLGYAIAFIPKFFHMFLAHIVRFRKFTDFSDFYNNVIVFSQVAANCILIGNIGIKTMLGKINFKNIFLITAIIYAIVFTLTPIYSMRYLFPAYILLVIVLSEKESNRFSLL